MNTLVLVFAATVAVNFDDEGNAALPPLVEYPYVSIYYSNPTVKPDEKVTVPFFVTDWHNSKVRLGDGSKRFDVMLKFGPSGGPYKTLTKKKVVSGDHTFTIGPFPRGDYECFVWTKDLQNGLESHRVWHEFRVRTAEELAISEAKTYRMTEQDLAKYGLKPEREDLWREVFVETKDSKTKLSETNLPSNVTVPVDGCVVLVPCDAKGERHHDTWRNAKVLYGAEYSHEKQAAIAAANTAGLQKLIDEKKAAGYRKVVLLKRKYRIVHEPSIMVPTEFTLDLGQATVRLDRFAGAGCYMFRIKDAYDSHLVNGTVEGDYYEHDYANSPNKAEWVDGVGIEGDSHYSSVENLTVTHITGYASTIGMSGEATYPNCKVGVGMMGKPTDGGLDLRTGEVVPAVGRYTGAFVDISNFGTNKLCVSHRLDPIRGLESRSWYMPVAFYDGDKKFISGEVSFLYRPLVIPKGAKFARVSVETATQLDARRCDLSLQFFRTPSLCAFRHNRFYLNRSTSHVPFVCREVITEENVFEHSGETLTHCAIDAEDGWEGLHDLYLRRNRFVNIPNAAMILNAGQNLVVDENVGSLSVRARVVSPCVRSNDCTSVNMLCGTTKGCAGHEHTMHARLIGNTIRNRLTLGGGRCEGSGWCNDGWTVVMSGTKLVQAGERRLAVEQGPSGFFRDMVFRGCAFEGPRQRFAASTFDDCTFTYNGSRGTWDGCTIENSVFLHSTSNVFSNCTLRGDAFAVIGGGYVGLLNCNLENTASRFQYWAAPAKIQMYGCDVKGTNALWNVGQYGLGRFQFRKCSFDLGKNAVVKVPDCRRTKEAETGSAVVSAEDCAFKSPLYEVTARSEFTSERPVIFAAAKCKGLKGGLGRRPEKLANWRELVDKEWTAYKKGKR